MPLLSLTKLVTLFVFTQFNLVPSKLNQRLHLGRLVGEVEKWKDGKYLVFSSCVFGWRGGKVGEWKTLLFGWREKENDEKYNLYKLTIILLLHNR